MSTVGRLGIVLRLAEPRSPRGPRGPRGSPESGAATALVAAVCGAVILVGAMAGHVVAAAVAATSARVAADLGALAGASALVAGLGGAPVDACTSAAVVVGHNDAELIRCEVDGSVNVTVEVSVLPDSALSWPSGLGPARATARAGPAPVTAERQ